MLSDQTFYDTVTCNPREALKSLSGVPFPAVILSSFMALSWQYHVTLGHLSRLFLSPEYLLHFASLVPILTNAMDPIHVHSFCEPIPNPAGFYFFVCFKVYLLISTPSVGLELKTPGSSFRLSHMLFPLCQPGNPPPPLIDLHWASLKLNTLHHRLCSQGYAALFHTLIFFTQLVCNLYNSGIINSLSFHQCSKVVLIFLYHH